MRESEYYIFGELRDKNGKIIDMYKNVPLNSLYKRMIEKYNIEEYREAIIDLINSENKKLRREFDGRRKLL